MRNDFAILILSHGRPNNVKTIKTLLSCGYTGKYYLVVDDEDISLDEYKKTFGEDNILVFSKDYAATKFDIMDNFEGRGVPTYARNVLHEIAKNLGLTYFLELEDDYTGFYYRYKDGNILRAVKVDKFDLVVDVFIDFLEVSNAKTVAFVQGGDLLGGWDRTIWKTRCIRKAMNCFFCKTDREFICDGRFNDDVNSYIKYGNLGDLYLSCVDICMVQPNTQSSAGGITDAYKLYGTYVKSLYSVMLRPDCVKVQGLNGTGGNNRFHHIIEWNNAVPKIISSKYKKGELK